MGLSETTIFLSVQERRNRKTWNNGGEVGRLVLCQE